MKKILFLLCLMALVGSMQAQTYSTQYVTYEDNNAVSTKTSDARYEFIQSSLVNKNAFLLDKYTGRVWRYRILTSKFEEIHRQPIEVVDTTQVNYQLYMSGENYSMCFLLNIHTGELWKYVHNANGGEKFFHKLEKPF